MRSLGLNAWRTSIRRQAIFLSAAVVVVGVSFAVVVSVVEDRRRALELGAVDHLLKPVDRHALLRSIMRGIAGRTPRTLDALV